MRPVLGIPCEPCSFVHSWQMLLSFAQRQELLFRHINFAETSLTSGEVHFPPNPCLKVSQNLQLQYICINADGSYEVQAIAKKKIRNKWFFVDIAEPPD